MILIKNHILDFNVTAKKKPNHEAIKKELLYKNKLGTNLFGLNNN
jgi:hypothetical protein